MLLWTFWICATPIICHAQNNGILCTGGEGRFTRISNDGVKVVVDAQKNNGLSTRNCEATLLWKKTETPVARDVWQADVDVMGVDFGLGGPVVAFQIKKSFLDSAMTYQVYSLRNSPQLLRTITGGGSFRAADTDLDGRVEIWATDANAVSGFEGIPLANFDFPPTIVMRFEGRRLIDVSAEFKHFYDQKIAELRTQLDSQQLSDFKSSNGKLDSIPPWEVDKLRRLLAVKTGVLEIVWAYLYGDREQEAWKALAEMWPAGDVGRIRELIGKVKAEGISSEVDGVSQASLSLRKLDRVHIFDLTEIKRSADAAAIARHNFPQIEQSEEDSRSEGGIVGPIAISMYAPPPQDPENAFTHAGVLVELVIDAAGKVSSAKLLNERDEGPLGESLLTASGHWKFIPAMRSGKAVASRIRLTVSPYQ